VASYYPTTTSGSVTTITIPGIVTIQNGAAPVVNISEQNITTLPDSTQIAVQTGVLIATISDSTVSFNIVDAVSGAVTGSATYAQLLSLLHSAYIDLATKRDAAASGG
jgi:hypothetical protein